MTSRVAAPLPDTVVLGPIPQAQPASSAAVAARVAPKLAVPALGAAAAAVAEVAGKQTVFAQDAQSARIPASVTKIATAVTALRVLGADDRMTTRVLQTTTGGTPTVVLVGGGDSTLVSGPLSPRQRASIEADGLALRPASLSDLADATARALKGQADRSVRLAFDASIFTGPALHASWPDTLVSAGLVAPVSGLMVDQGRPTPDAQARVADPAKAAATKFAALLTAKGITIAGPVRAQTLAQLGIDPGQNPIAAVQSPPLVDIVEFMLTDSDNDVAEAVGRLAAVSLGKPGTRAQAAALVAQTAASLGAAGTSLADTSGLSRENRISAQGVVNILESVSNADPQAPERGLLSGLAVAGETGTLATRFEGASSSATGRVRAKSGTLTGVNSLAGFSLAADGALYSFAFLADRSLPGASRPALDAAAAALTSCGCTRG